MFCISHAVRWHDRPQELLELELPWRMVSSGLLRRENLKSYIELPCLLGKEIYPYNDIGLRISTNVNFHIWFTDHLLFIMDSVGLIKIFCFMALGITTTLFLAYHYSTLNWIPEHVISWIYDWQNWHNWSKVCQFWDSLFYKVPTTEINNRKGKSWIHKVLSTINKLHNFQVITHCNRG
jgi:hypothetical protein